jgi:alcohol dehydrogenase class IV
MIENIYIGKDSISNLSEILKLHSGKKVFLVTGKSSYEKSGAQGIMESLLKGIP